MLERLQRRQPQDKPSAQPELRRVLVPPSRRESAGGYGAISRTPLWSFRWTEQKTLRTLESVQKPGRWKSAKSVCRNEKSGRVNQSWSELTRNHRPLRSVTRPWRLPALNFSGKCQVTKDNLCVAVCLRVVRACISLRIPFCPSNFLGSYMRKFSGLQNQISMCVVLEIHHCVGSHWRQATRLVFGGHGSCSFREGHKHWLLQGFLTQQSALASQVPMQTRIHTAKKIGPHPERNRSWPPCCITKGRPVPLTHHQRGDERGAKQKSNFFLVNQRMEL